MQIHSSARSRINAGAREGERSKTMRRAKSVEDYIAHASHWQNELNQLRAILCATELTEEIKWGAPCYTYDGKNIVGLGSYKSYVGLWFHQGALLKDTSGVLINAQEGKTKALRQWRMTSPADIKASVIKRYLNEAIKLAKEGKTIKPDRDQPIVVPPELKSASGREKGAVAAFRKFTPGKQREFANYVAEAKQRETKQRRVAKILPKIVAGTGLNDKYR